MKKADGNKPLSAFYLCPDRDDFPDGDVILRSVA